MFSVVMNALGVYKYLIFIALAAGAYWFVWDTGRGFERARWETAMAKEVSRQQTIIDAALVASEEAAALLLSAEDQRVALVRKLSNAALSAPNSGNPCLDAASILRLNALGGKTNAH